jgi:threonine dehydratase
VIFSLNHIPTGTIGLEVIDAVPDLDVLVVPVGGGGMISGIAKAVKQIKPNIRIVGVEPSKIPSMRKAVIENDFRSHPAVTTIADGINVRHLMSPPVSCNYIL